MLSFSIDISAPVLEDTSRNILKEFMTHISKSMLAATPAIIEKTKELVSKSLTESVTWAALDGGSLAQLLCIPSPAESLNAIHRNILDEVSITNKQLNFAGGALSGGFNVNILDDKYANITNLPTSNYTTINGQFVPWLEWLLFYGNSPVTADSILINTNKGVILVRASGNLSIPTEHSGTADSNFITRSLKPVEEEVGKIIELEMTRRV